MNKFVFLILSIFCTVVHAGAQPTDDELLRQGKELVQKLSAKAEQASAHPEVPSLNTKNDSPLLQPHPYIQSEQKDFMDFAMGKKKLTQASAKKTDLLIFVSFSLPAETLKEYSKQAAEYGAVLVLRGFRNNSVQETKTEAFNVNPTGAEWDIAPATFRKFKIDHVPSIVLSDASVTSVLNDGCAKEGDYLRVDGDISVHQALVIMKQNGQGKLIKAAEALLETENH